MSYMDALLTLKNKGREKCFGDKENITVLYLFYYHFRQENLNFALP